MINKRLKWLWCTVRQLTGDDAYERYLEHAVSHGHSKSELLTRKQFFIQKETKKWDGIKRCC